MSRPVGQCVSLRSARTHMPARKGYGRERARLCVQLRVVKSAGKDVWRCWGSISNVRWVLKT